MDKQNVVIYTLGYYLVIKRDELINAITWVNPANIMRGERSSLQRPHILLFHLSEMSRIAIYTN